jgi:putative tryptophan/tyrosine transport system substrate-binding protein
VKFGLLESLNHPGGNLAGIGLLAYLLEAKRLELVHELLPRASKVAVLVNPTNSETDSGLLDLQAAAPTLGQHLIILHAGSETDITTAFTILRQQQAEAMVVSPDPFLLSRHGQIVELAARLAIPASTHGVTLSKQVD